VELVKDGIILCLVPQNIYEFWVAASRPLAVNGLEMDVPLVHESIEGLLRDFVLLKDERGIFGNWQSLVNQYSVKGKGAHDARLVAAMQRHGLTSLLTFNRPDFSRFTKIETLTPVDILEGQRPSVIAS